MWAGIVYGTLLEHYGNHILLSGGAQVFLDDAVLCDFPVDTYPKVTYTEIPSSVGQGDFDLFCPDCRRAEARVGFAPHRCCRCPGCQVRGGSAPYYLGLLPLLLRSSG